MSKRSLQTSVAGIQQAKRAFALKGWTQENLAGEVGLKTRQPIWRFFTGKPVDRHVFLEVCHILDLEWRKIADRPPAEFPQSDQHLESISIDTLIERIRSHRKETIETQCGILQLLDINHPVSIDDIYVDVNILEEIASQQWFEIANLKNIEPTQFDRIGMGAIKQKQIPGIQAVETYSKLRVLGRPGVGKTTFLQYLAILCNRGEFLAHQVPIFITLRDFAEESRESNKFSLLDYLYHAFLVDGISDPAIVESLLKQGRVLVLLDGMDEIPGQDSTNVLREIRKFLDQYHKNQFVVSCRTAASKLQLRGFTDVEVAPFTKVQIATFAQKRFGVFAKTSPKLGSDQTAQFIKQLDSPENWSFRQLVTTPLFLHLACWVFHGQNSFPTKRAEFYKQGLDLLLGKWDESKGVGRDDGYRGFSLPQKLRLFSQLAAVTFEQGQYFFEHQVIEQYISDYLGDLPNTSLEPEELQLESEVMLKEIEAQHGILIERARGIFSFSYLVFQEYFTARKIIANHNLSALEQSLGELVSHITDPRWHEVFLLTATMLRSADSLVQLMKQKIDALVAQDCYLQEFLMWVLLLKFPTNFTDIRDCHEALNSILGTIVDAEFYKSLQQLRDQLPGSNQSKEERQEWWQKNYATWLKELQETIAKYHNINHPWRFTAEQQQILQSYYLSSQLLLDCLNSNCEITIAIR